MRITLPYDYGEIVYLKIRPEKVKGMVTGYHLNYNAVMIAVTWADTCQEIRHYEFELSKEFIPDYESDNDEHR